MQRRYPFLHHGRWLPKLARADATIPVMEAILKNNPNILEEKPCLSFVKTRQPTTGQVALGAAMQSLKPSNVVFLLSQGIQFDASSDAVAIPWIHYIERMKEFKEIQAILETHNLPLMRLEP